jgi:hypothetical protein
MAQAVFMVADERTVPLGTVRSVRRTSWAGQDPVAPDTETTTDRAGPFNLHMITGQNAKEPPLGGSWLY